MEDREFDSLFSGLKDREITPSANALDQLHAALNKEENKTKKTKLKPIWWAAAAVASLLLGVGVYNNSNKSIQLPSEIVFSEPNFEKTKPELPQETYTQNSSPTREQVLPIEKVQEELKISLSTAVDIQLARVNEEVDSTTSLIDSDLEEEEHLKASTVAEERLAGLLKPIEEEELDLLLQEKGFVSASDLLTEDPNQAEVQKSMEYTSVDASNLLQQVEIELEANKSLGGMFSKVLEIGVAEVQTYLKRRY